MENIPSSSAVSESVPTVIVQKPLIKSSITPGLLAVISLLPCILSGAVLGYTGVTLSNLEISFRSKTWFASFALLGASGGCLISQSMINTFGPRGTSLLSHLVGMIGWILTISSLTTLNFFIGRILLGLFVGITSISVSAYCAECFPRRLSARPVVYTALGVFCIYFCGSLLNYRQTAFIAFVVTILSFFLVRMYVPESPAWLESKGKMGDAEYSKLKLRLTETPNNDLEVQPGLKFVKNIKKQAVYKPFLALCLHFTLQQLSGPLAVVAYAVEIIGDSGVRILNGYFIAVILSAFMVMGALVSTAMDHKESTNILSATGIVISGIVIGVFNLIRSLVLNRVASQMLSFIPLLGILLLIISSCTALVPSLPIKNTNGEHTALGFNYFIGFVVVKCYPYAQAYLGWWIFIIFAVMASLDIVTCVLFFSEPKKSHPSEEPGPSV
ncbi:uncharacterized protein LOC126908428 [Daktulosphaira vitifoliae]|uniref:uncharacterized protein LOC126908428 n=1 Tax=Daktulosphaira vitifoliae TaxID=58002 RepID=UPI0021AA7BED|nr:uncharacterized protein LOC126908428 [Daktulosphaira vitifoliae]